MTIFAAQAGLQLARRSEHGYPAAVAGLPGTAVARLRIRLTHLYCHGRLPNFADPTLFNDLVQVRKLADHDPRLPFLADKVHAKQFAANRLGPDRTTPTLWTGTTLPKAADWPVPFVVKSRHGCGQSSFVRSPDDDWDKIRRQAHRWTQMRYGKWLDEWLYGQIDPGLLVEPMIGDGVTLPIDYKFFVFAGRVEFVQVHLDRERNHRWIVFDRNWLRITTGPKDDRLMQPSGLAAMIADAETLGADFDFVRVDMYQIDGKPRFGEMTFYPGSGLGAFNPRSLDADMGKFWLAARPKLAKRRHGRCCANTGLANF